VCLSGTVAIHGSHCGTGVRQLQFSLVYCAVNKPSVLELSLRTAGGHHQVNNLGLVGSGHGSLSQTHLVHLFFEL